MRPAAAAGAGSSRPTCWSRAAIPRKTIGTVNTAEFFLTVTISATFIATLGWQAFTTATLGLLIGGVCAAPFGAWIAKRVNPDTLLTFVGALLTLTSSTALSRAELTPRPSRWLELSASLDYICSAS